MMNYFQLVIVALSFFCLLPSCNSSSKDSQDTDETVDRISEADLTAKEGVRIIKVAAAKDPVYNCSDTIPFGDLRIVINQLGKVQSGKNSLNRTNRVLGKPAVRTTSFIATIINQGTETKELPFVHFAELATRRTSSSEPPFYTASRVLLNPKTQKIQKNIQIKPGAKMQVNYVSVINKTSNWLLRFTEGKQELDTSVSEGKQLQGMLDASGVDVSIITDEYKGTSAYVDLKDAIEK